MYISFIVTIFKRILPFFIIVFLGCANLDVAQSASQKGDYNKSIKIWQKWAKAGYAKYNLKLASLADTGIIKSDDRYVIKNALKAYNAGFKKAAFILEKVYYKKGDSKKALFWFGKSDLNLTQSFEIYNMDINLITNYINSFKKQFYYINKMEKLAPENIAAAYSLGCLFENHDTPFYNIDKSLHYFQIAWNKKYTPAGIKLALILIRVKHKTKKGLDLLRKISTEDNGLAAYLIGKFLYKDMNEYMQKINTPCITCNFKNPYEFYKKKLELQLFKNKFMWTNVVPWFEYSYKRGYIRGKLQLISLDIQENNYFRLPVNKHYSKMDINETLNYLQGLGNGFKLFAPKMILAQLVIKYPVLNKYYLAKNIYTQYMDINKTDALWHLYLYSKLYDKPAINRYLRPLVKKRFTPALIENAYLNYLKDKDKNSSLKVLRFFAKNNNIKALHYLSSIYSKGIVKNVPKIEVCKLYKKLCKLESPLNITLDRRIAGAYLRIINPPEVIKAATIYKFYAEQNDSISQYELANIYTKYNDVNKTVFWLTKSQKNGYERAEILYAKLVLSGIIKGDVNKYLKMFVHYVKKYKNPQDLVFLGDLYSKGNIVDLDPEKAEIYYRMALKEGYYRAYVKLANLYIKTNLANDNYNLIVNNLKQAINHNIESAKIVLANFYVNNRQNNLALKLLKTLDLSKNPRGYYLFYKLTGHKIYLTKAIKYNIGGALLAYAKSLKNNNKALLYTFRASLCNIPRSSDYSYELMKRINDSSIIKQIFNKAKKYPMCR